MMYSFAQPLGHCEGNLAVHSYMLLKPKHWQDELLPNYWWECMLLKPTQQQATTDIAADGCPCGW
jgi:hypothetical protein